MPAPLLLDRYLPEYDVSECHARVVAGDASSTWDNVRQVDLARLPLVRALLLIRSAPGRLRARASGRTAPGPPPFTLDDMTGVGWVLLEEHPREIALGTVSRPWALGDEQPRPLGPDEYAVFREPGWVRIAFMIRAEPYGAGRTLVTTETRVATTDAVSRRRFAAYWRVIGPFSGLIRRLLLRRLDRQGRRLSAR